MPQTQGRRKGQDIATPETAEYIAQAVSELAAIAGGARWPMLTYFLNMARIEAETKIPVRRAVERRKSTRPFWKPK